MKAEVKPRIELEGRTRLETVIPIGTPFTVFIDPSNLCNFGCTFCPTGSRGLIRSTGRKQTNMGFDLFKKVIDDLGQFDGKVKVARLYKDGEPMLNPKFAEMIGYAKRSARVERVDSTTNGSFLEPETNRRIVDAGLDRLNISIEGMSGQVYRDFARWDLDFDGFVRNIRDLYEHRGQCEIVVKTVAENLKEGERDRFLQIFGEISDRIFVENMAPCWPQFDCSHLPASFEVGIYGQPVFETEVCPYVFYSMAVNSDGSVSLCFLDWAHRLIIGDVRSQSLREIWEGEEMFCHRRRMLELRRHEHAVCGRCGQLTHCQPDNIDAYAPALLQKLLQSRARPGTSSAPPGRE